MTCQEFHDYFKRVDLGTAAERVATARHYIGCQPCREEVIAVSALVKKLVGDAVDAACDVEAASLFAKDIQDPEVLETLRGKQ